MVKSLFGFALLTTLCALFVSCAKDKKARTELMLVADTDIDNLDSIIFEVTDGDRIESEEGSPRDGGEPLTLGVVLADGSSGPIRVSAQGMRAGRAVVERSAVVSFVPAKTLVVVLHLFASCESRRCLSNQTCSERGCESNQLDGDQLEEWTGSPPAIGGSLLADGGGVSEAGALSDASSDAASGLVTCGSDTKVDLLSNVDHCGDCKIACKASGRNLVAACVAGECTEECRTLTGDCDGNATNGCEQSLSVSANCGMCGMRCATGNSCLFGTCR